MKTTHSAETTRSTTMTTDSTPTTLNGAEGEMTDPWQQLIEVIAQQLVKAWASEIKSKPSP